MIPMLATPTSPTANRPGQTPTDPRFSDWFFDLKLDGIRAIIRIDNGGKAIIHNRNEVDITWRYPDVVEDLESRDFLNGTLLDGEIIARSGSFEDALTRDKQGNAANASSLTSILPVRFVAFDVLTTKPGQTIAGNTLSHRRAVLKSVAADSGISVVPYTIGPGIVEVARDMGFEGVIAKNPISAYTEGRSRHWLKFKNTHRITCIATGYEPGNGAREAIGAVHLTLLDEHSPVSVGRVGSGFTNSSLHEIKGLLDDGKPVLVEIECLNVTSSGVLRFPVYKGIRTDKTLKDATIAQLHDIPTA